ncbi:MAG: fatty acid desaturase, partial [Anaerolineales bacterium]
MPIMDAEPTNRRIAWYKSPIARAELAALNQRSDWQGLLQTVGHLGLLLLTGAAAWYSVGRLPLLAVLALIYFHGLVFAFLVNAFHEFVHQTVFKTKAINTFFLQLVSFMSWQNPVMFWASHQEHHKYTLHPPDDMEVVLPQKLELSSFLKALVVNPWDLYFRLRLVIRLCFGRLDGPWEKSLFPPSAVAERASLFRWARIILLGHILIVAVSLYLGWWMVPVLLTLAPFYGGGLQYLCNNTQHAGLQDKVADYRLCTRTFTVNPFVQFLYWHMNFHIEHHMYAAVPCYNLAKLHAALEADMPPYPRGLIAAWREILPIMARQKQDPTYQFI